MFWTTILNNKVLFQFFFNLPYSEFFSTYNSHYITKKKYYQEGIKTGRGYLEELFRQIRTYLWELLRQLKTYLPEPVPAIKKLFAETSSTYLSQYISSQNWIPWPKK